MSYIDFLTNFLDDSDICPNLRAAGLREMSYFPFNIGIRKLISNQHSPSPCAGKSIQIFLYGLIVITLLLIMIIINYEVNSNSIFLIAQAKNLGMILDYFFHITIQSMHQ